VVHDYGDVCQSITELAVELDAPISADDFRVLNGCLDNAIAGAVTEFDKERAHAPVKEVADRKNEQRAASDPILRNLIHNALVAFEAVKSGKVGVAGSTGAVIQKSLVGALDMMDRSLAAEDRLTQEGKK